MRALLLAVAIVVIASPALAGPQCTTEPSANWLPEEVIKQKAVAMGHSIAVFKKTDGNCYEIYGRDSAGKRIEIYFNPMNGEIVRQGAR